jgi:hypothetical protein
MTAHIEFEDSRDHHDGLRLMSVLEQGKPDRFGTIDEQSAATVPLILNDPVAVAVLADKEEVGLRPRRGRFLLVHDLLAHDTSPQVSSAAREQRICVSW